MLPQAAERIRTALATDAEVLQVSGARRPLGRADVVLDDRPYEGRGEAQGPERFTRRSWLVRDVCGREPWPFEDGRFAFAVCDALATLRDPVGVCAELSRVARAGYVEVPTVEAELGAGARSDARWLCDPVTRPGATGAREAELVFVAKPYAAHGDPRLRVPARWLERLPEGERVHGLFWTDRLPARERLADPGALLDELAERVRRRFAPSTAEVAVQEARGAARRVGGAAGTLVERALRGR